MTDDELLHSYHSGADKTPVAVTAADYSYDGWIVSVFMKRGGQLRCVVEDGHGRLFIHNAKQLSAR